MLLHTLYLIAIVGEAMSGALMGMRRGMDRFGLCLVRDVLLGHYPLAWISHSYYVFITITAAAGAAAHTNPAHARLRAPPIKEHARTLSISRPDLAGRPSVATRPYSYS